MYRMEQAHRGGHSASCASRDLRPVSIGPPHDHVFNVKAPFGEDPGEVDLGERWQHPDEKKAPLWSCSMRALPRLPSDSVCPFCIVSQSFDEGLLHQT